MYVGHWKSAEKSQPKKKPHHTHQKGRSPANKRKEGPIKGNKKNPEKIKPTWGYQESRRSEQGREKREGDPVKGHQKHNHTNKELCWSSLRVLTTVRMVGGDESERRGVLRAIDVPGEGERGQPVAAV